MDLFLNLGWIILGLVLLYFGAEWLVRGASSIALRCGLSPLVVGLTVVAFGTSAPELVVSVKANLDGNGGMALGNVVGSNICNIALVLGMAAVIAPVGIVKQVIRREMPVLLVVTGLFVFFLRDGLIHRGEGAVLALLVVAYVIVSVLVARREGKVVQEEATEEVPEDLILAARSGGLGRVLLDLGLVVVGILLLVVGADRMVFGGERIALGFGVSKEVVALTLFAFGTSLPELATSVVASLKNEGDIVIGNVVGSCIFNILAVVGVTGVVAPLAQGALKNLDLWVMTGLTVILLPMMRSGWRVTRREGWLLVLGYGAYTGWLAMQELG